MEYIVNEEFIETFENTLVYLRCYANKDDNKELKALIDNVLETIKEVKENNIKV